MLNALRRRYPSAEIDWLVTPAIAELLRHNPAISNVIEFARDEWSKPWRLTPFINYARLARNLRANDYDLLVDMHGQLRTAVLVLASGAPVRIGFDRPRASVCDASPRRFPAEARKHAWQGAREGSWLAYTHHIPVPSLDIHAVDRYLSVCPMLGLDARPPDFSFPIPQAASTSVDTLLHERGLAGARLLAMAPGTIWETKHWGAGKFAQVARHFLHKGFAVALMGSQRERSVCEQVARLAPGTVDIAGETTLTELVALIRRSAISVTNDSEPMHLAVALPARREHFWPNRSNLDWTVRPSGRSVAGWRPLLAVLVAPAQPLPLRARVHGGRLSAHRDRADGARAERQWHRAATRAGHFVYGRLTGPLGGGPHSCVAS